MSALFKNNATALLAASISTSGTTLVLAAGTGINFPVLTGSDFFYGTIYDSAGNYEIVKVTARAADSLTVVRAQEGTTALAFSSGDAFAQRVTAASLNDFAQKSVDQTFTGVNTFDGVTDFNANVTGTTATFSGAISSVSPAFTGVPTAPTAATGTNTTQIATTAFVLVNGVPAGGILMWSGSIASIPSGFYLCDGTNGTPDLRDRFVMGAGGTYAVNATGGSADATLVAHTHSGSTSTTGAHTHTYQGSNYQPNNAAGSVPDWIGASTMTTNSAGDHAHTFTTNSAGSSATNANLPPYFALAYIMKA